MKLWRYQYYNLSYTTITLIGAIQAQGRSRPIAAEQVFNYTWQTSPVVLWLVTTHTSHLTGEESFSCQKRIFIEYVWNFQLRWKIILGKRFFFIPPLTYGNSLENLKICWGKGISILPSNSFVFFVETFIGLVADLNNHQHNHFFPVICQV